MIWLAVYILSPMSPTLSKRLSLSGTSLSLICLSLACLSLATTAKANTTNATANLHTSSHHSSPPSNDLSLSQPNNMPTVIPNSYSDNAGTLTLVSSSADWQTVEHSGVIAQDNALIVADPHNSGHILGPVLPMADFDELIPSWNARTWSKGSLKLEIRVLQSGQWSSWYSFGTWSNAEGRASAQDQKTALGELKTDVLQLSQSAQALQYRVQLHGQGVKLSLLAFHTSHRSQNSAANSQISSSHSHRAWGKVLALPKYSQMQYRGGDVWCSPTSVAMILAHYGVQISVPQAAKGMYDATYEGTGNWPFNTAFAAEQGLQAFITRLPDLTTAEKYISAGVPLAVSLGWEKGQLRGSALPKSSGHLMALVGFDTLGNPILHDPAAPNISSVQRSYPRKSFEKLWQQHSGGMAYVIFSKRDSLPLSNSAKYSLGE